MIVKIIKYIFVFSLWALVGCGLDNSTTIGSLTNPPSSSHTPSAPPPPSTRCRESLLSKNIPRGETAQSIAKYSSGSLFSAKSGDMPTLKDVRQAGFNVCYLYAFLSAYVARYPDKIKDSIKRIKDGFEVYIFDDNLGSPCVFISDLQLGIFRNTGNTQTSTLWPEVLAGAFVSHLGQGNMKMAEDVEVAKTGTDKDLGVAELRKGNTIDLSIVRKDPFKYFLNQTGKIRRIKPKLPAERTNAFLADAKDLVDFVDSCLKADCVMYGYIAPGGENPGPMTRGGLPNGLIDHHCYGVLGANKRTQEVFVRNPHGGKNAKSAVYGNDGVMRPGIQTNERFSLRAEDFYKNFYTLQFSEF